MSRMRQLEKGYTPSDEVTAARALWESLQGQKPGEYESRFQQQLAGHIAVGRGQLFKELALVGRVFINDAHLVPPLCEDVGAESSPT